MVYRKYIQVPAFVVLSLLPDNGGGRRKLRSLFSWRGAGDRQFAGLFRKAQIDKKGEGGGSSIIRSENSCGKERRKEAEAAAKEEGEGLDREMEEEGKGARSLDP